MEMNQIPGEVSDIGYNQKNLVEVMVEFFIRTSELHNVSSDELSNFGLIEISISRIKNGIKIKKDALLDFLRSNDIQITEQDLILMIRQIEIEGKFEVGHERNSSGNYILFSQKFNRQLLN